MTHASRIDVHQHIVPPFWARALPAHGGDPSGTVAPDWSPETAVAFMDSQQIATGILSLTAPGVVQWPTTERREMARRVNEYTANVVSARPDRFGNFATLPLPDVEGALLELDYALDTLHADGVILLANVGGQYLGDPAFEPLWAELDRRHALVFIHPGQPPLQTIHGVAGPLVDYPFDTTRAAVQLVLNGVVGRYPNVSIILAHAGGFLPYASHRFAELAQVFRPELDDPAALLKGLQSFYFDTALSAGDAVFPTLKAFAGDRILFGSDFPYAPAHVASRFTDKLDSYAGFIPAERSMINRGKALELIPRLRLLTA